MHRPVPSRILLSGRVHERTREGVRIGEFFLSIEFVCSNGCHARVVCDGGRRGIDEEWAGGVFGGDGTRWSNASVRNVDRGEMSGQHRGLERDDGVLASPGGDEAAKPRETKMVESVAHEAAGLLPPGITSAGKRITLKLVAAE